MKLIIKIAAGILLAGAISATIGLGVTGYIAYKADQQIQERLAEQKARREEQQRQRQALQQTEAQQKRQAALKAQQVKQQRLAEERANNALDKAFSEQYEPPPSCINPQSNTRWVECVDLRRSAKAEFRKRILSQEYQDITIVGH